MPIPRTTLNIQRVRDTIGKWIEDTLQIPSYFANQNAPRPARPYCAFSFPLGMFAPIADYQDSPRVAPKKVLFTVPGPIVVGEPSMVDINGFVFKYIAQNGDNEDSVRDQLVSLINDEAEPVQATALGGLGQFEVQGTSDGHILSAKGVGDITAEVTETVEVMETGGIREIPVAFELYSTTATGMESVEMMQDVLQTSLGEYPTLEYFNQRHLSVWGELQPGIDLSATENAENESRLRFELRFSTRARLIRPAEIIEKVELELDMGGHPVLIEAETPP